MAEAGAVTYAGSCASCHGGDLAGQPDWKTPLADGSYPAPPHDASGHTWHHSTPSLVELIRDGSADTRSSMPSFADRLTDDEILSVIEFLRSRWGDVERNWQWQITWMEARRRGE